jgi:hypothetical protein
LEGSTPTTGLEDRDVDVSSSLELESNGARWKRQMAYQPWESELNARVQDCCSCAIDDGADRTNDVKDLPTRRGLIGMSFKIDMQLNCRAWSSIHETGGSSHGRKNDSLKERCKLRRLIGREANELGMASGRVRNQMHPGRKGARAKRETIFLFGSAGALMSNGVSFTSAFERRTSWKRDGVL